MEVNGFVIGSKYSSVRLIMTGDEGETYEQIPTSKGKFALYLSLFTHDCITTISLLSPFLFLFEVSYDETYSLYTLWDILT